MKEYKTKSKSHTHRIEVNLHNLGQLFNSMDPSPFHEKDLDRDAEEFIVSWAQEYPLHEPVRLIVHLQQLPRNQNAQAIVEASVGNYFAYRAKLNRLDLRRLLKEGRSSLVIGLGFLLLCLSASEILGSMVTGGLQRVIREGLTIAGWVAMWRPMQIYLYEWWPLHRRGAIFRKLSKIHVEVKNAGERSRHDHDGGLVGKGFDSNSPNGRPAHRFEQMAVV